MSHAACGKPKSLTGMASFWSSPFHSCSAAAITLR